MSKVVPPFLEIGGRLMVVANWAPDLTADHILLLRPLNADELAWLQRPIEDAYFEIFSRLFPEDGERLRGADFSDFSGTRRETI